MRDDFTRLGSCWGLFTKAAICGYPGTRAHPGAKWAESSCNEERCIDGKLREDTGGLACVQPPQIRSSVAMRSLIEGAAAPLPMRHSEEHDMNRYTRQTVADSCYSESLGYLSSASSSWEVHVRERRWIYRDCVGTYCTRSGGYSRAVDSDALEESQEGDCCDGRRGKQIIFALRKAAAEHTIECRVRLPYRGADARTSCWEHQDSHERGSIQ